jgi:DNA-binding NarL/FixJ family response regulator
MSPITIVLVDHHALVRSALSALLDRYPEFEVVGEASGGQEALELLANRHADVALMDIDIPGTVRGLDWLAIFRTRFAETRVVVLTNTINPAAIQEALRAGAMGYLLKSITPDELTQAIAAAYRGIATYSPEITQALIQAAAAPSAPLRQLTAREHQILELMARGWNNQQIATELNISLSTVQFHVSNILAKLHVHNRTEAASIALRNDLLAPGTSWAEGQA